MILDNIAKLKQLLIGAEQSDFQTVDTWELQAKKALAMMDLQYHEGIKIILEKLESDLKGINLKLLHDRSLTAEKREHLFEQKDWIKSILDLFVNAEKTIQQLDKQVLDNIDYVQQISQNAD